MREIITGFYYIYAGFGLITKSGIKRYILIPVLFNILFFSILFVAFNHYILELDRWLQGYLPGWLSWLAILCWLFAIISFILLFIYTFAIAGNVFSAPFNSILSEKVQCVLAGHAMRKSQSLISLKNIASSIGRQIHIIWYFLPRAFLLLVLFFIPLIQFFAPFLWFIFNARFLTMMYVDYPAENNEISFQSVRQRLAEDRWRVMGLGCGMLLINLVPVINFIAMPVSVIAATIYWVERQQK